MVSHFPCKNMPFWDVHHFQAHPFCKRLQYEITQPRFTQTIAHLEPAWSVPSIYLKKITPRFHCWVTKNLSLHKFTMTFMKYTNQHNSIMTYTLTFHHFTISEMVIRNHLFPWAFFHSFLLNNQRLTPTFAMQTPRGWGWWFNLDKMLIFHH